LGYFKKDGDTLFHRVVDLKSSWEKIK